MLNYNSIYLEAALRPLKLTDLSPEAIDALDRLYRSTRDVRLRTRAQIILLAAEKRYMAAEIAGIVRTDEQTVRRWLKRYQDQGIDGLSDVPRPGGPRKVTDDYLEKLLAAVQCIPAELGLSFPTWTAEHLAEYMAGKTLVKVDPETIRLHLRAEGIVLGRAQIERIRPSASASSPVTQAQRTRHLTHLVGS